MTNRCFRALVLGATLALGVSGTATAQMMAGSDTQHAHNDHAAHGQHMQGHMKGHGHGHGPIGVMGRHLMPEGKFMLNYRFGHMEMSGLRFGTTDLSADQAATLPNPFAGMPGMPPDLRVIPHEMSMTMHMFGAMYGASDRVTLMAMLPYVEKKMTMITYQGPTGTTVLGANTARSKGIGDIRLGAVFGLMQSDRMSLNANLALSLPTGSITETGQMLTPMGMRATRRLGYNMQLGSGTFDLHPALTYETRSGNTALGAQINGIIRLGTNDEGYSLGNEAALTAWLSHQAAPWISLSGRIEARHTGRIDGRDVNIMGPSPAANPAYAGGQSVTMFAGVDFTPKSGALKGHRIGLELGAPIYQDLNGPMLKRDWQIALAWRKGF